MILAGQGIRRGVAGHPVRLFREGGERWQVYIPVKKACEDALVAQDKESFISALRSRWGKVQAPTASLTASVSFHKQQM